MSIIQAEGKLFRHIHAVIDNRRVSHSFTSVAVNRQINALGSTYKLEFPDRWLNSGEEFSFPIGKSIRLVIGERTTVLYGHIEQINSNLSENTHTIAVSGRDLTGDLIDCSPPQSQEFINLTLAQIAERICKPFGIAVFDEVKDSVQFPTAKLRPGETAFRFLNRLSKQRGLLLCSAAELGGGLTICKVGVHRLHRTKLDHNNILRCTLNINASQVFSEYNVISQTNYVSYTGDDTAEVESESSNIGTVKDDSIGRYRPMTFIPERGSNAEQAASRAKWEASKRQAEMMRINITVSGWLNGDDELWRENRLVKLTYLPMGLDDTYLIAGVSYVYGANESQKTTLTLVPKNSYQPAKTVTAVETAQLHMLTREQLIAAGVSFKPPAKTDNTGARE